MYLKLMERLHNMCLKYAEIICKNYYEVCTLMRRRYTEAWVAGAQIYIYIYIFVVLLWIYNISKLSMFREYPIIILYVMNNYIISNLKKFKFCLLYIINYKIAIFLMM